MRFRPEQHLRRQSEIRAVRERGQRFDCKAFTVWWKAREAAVGTAWAEHRRDAPGVARPERARVCVIASGNAVGRAVQRNRAKRRLREVFRHQQENVPANCDLLLIARRAALTLPLPELERKFVEACLHLGAGGTPALRP